MENRKTTYDELRWFKHGERARRDPKSPFATCGMCKDTVVLLPVRYGLVEKLSPPAKMKMPYSLLTHPLGLRLVRPGFLYLIDSRTQHLHEVSIGDGVVETLLFKGRTVTADARASFIAEPAQMVFARKGHLHVAFSELRWTVAKCNLMLAFESEREHFMQFVELPGVGANERPPLYYRIEMGQWLAEATLTRDDDWIRPIVHPGVDLEHSRADNYPWEHAPLFRHTYMGELLRKANDEHWNDCLFLAVRDDIGVMRDLAHYQDQVVGQIEDWSRSGSEKGQVERDYLLGCYIESLTQLSPVGLEAKAKLDPELKALLDELEQLPEPQQSQTRKTLLEVLGEDSSQHSLPGVSDANLPTDLQVQLDQIRITANPYRENGYAVLVRLERTLQQYYLEQKFVGTDPAFLERHRQALWRVYQQQDKRNRELLYGARFGQRGINDLIDRPAMDAFVTTQRLHLQSLNSLLDRITDDRLAMLTENRFHRAAWYFDIEDPQQVEQALLTEYACLKDICRNDKAQDQVLAWLNDNPAYSRPLFHTLPLSTQTELRLQLVLFTNAGWLLIKDSPQWLARFKQWGAGVILDADKLSDAAHINANAAWGSLAPAIQNGMQQATQGFLQDLNSGQMPEIDELFRRMPKATSLWVLDAIRRENVTFQVASVDELKTLRGVMRNVLDNRHQLRSLGNVIQQNRLSRGRYDPESDNRYSKKHRRELQSVLLEQEKRLMSAMSPISEVPAGSVHLQEPTSIRAGLTLVFPPEQHAQVKSVLDSYKRGAAIAPVKGLLGDGVGLLVFLAQLVNLVQIAREAVAEPTKKVDWIQLWSSISATAAAGFGAAQGIADTALSAYAEKLAKNLQAAQLQGVHVQMGKLHIGLGAGGYLGGAIAAGLSLISSHNNWQDAVRSGNREAQGGATLSMMGNGGFLASNTYGFLETWGALRLVLAAEANSPARFAAWALAGPRLSTVLFRFNVVGILFTALELSGTWIYNRHNLSQHDRWLRSTPWSQDLEKRQSFSLTEYQRRLRAAIQTPRVVIIAATTDEQGVTQPKQYLLQFPTLSASDLAEPLGDGDANLWLRLGGYRIVRAHTGRDRTPEHWAPLAESLPEQIRLKRSNPLILELFLPGTLIDGREPERIDLMLTVNLLYRRPDGQYEGSAYNLRFPLTGEVGEFPAFDQDHQGEECQCFNIVLAELVQDENAHD